MPAATTQAWRRPHPGEGAPEEHRPAEVEAGHGGVGVHEGLRLLGLVADAVEHGHRVDKAREGDETGRGNRVEGVDDDTDRARGEEGGAHESVGRAVPDPEEDGEGDDEGHVPPEVDPVHGADGPVLVDDPGLPLDLPVHARGAFERDEVETVGERLAGAIDDGAADEEVDEEGDHDDDRLLDARSTGESPEAEGLRSYGIDVADHGRRGSRLAASRGTATLSRGAHATKLPQEGQRWTYP